MEIPEIIKALRRNMVETGSLICIGCGREHNCSIYGCAIMREAADALEEMAAEKQDTDAHLKAISDSLSEQLRRAAPENKPLTLEQLRQMARDLLTSCVVHEAEKADCAAIIDYDNIGKFGPKNNIIAVVSAFGQPLLEKDYAKTWLAYAHKPEQEADHEKA